MVMIKMIAFPSEDLFFLHGCTVSVQKSANGANVLKQKDQDTLIEQSCCLNRTFMVY